VGRWFESSLAHWHRHETPATASAAAGVSVAAPLREVLFGEDEVSAATCVIAAFSTILRLSGTELPG
jgi:hypothetical protein